MRPLSPNGRICLRLYSGFLLGFWVSCLFHSDVDVLQLRRAFRLSAKILFVFLQSSVASFLSNSKTSQLLTVILLFVLVCALGWATVLFVGRDPTKPGFSFWQRATKAVKVLRSVALSDFLIPTCRRMSQKVLAFHTAISQTFFSNSGEKGKVRSDGAHGIAAIFAVCLNPHFPRMNVRTV